MESVEGHIREVGECKSGIDESLAILKREIYGLAEEIQLYEKLITDSLFDGDIDKWYFYNDEEMNIRWRLKHQ